MTSISDNIRLTNQALENALTSNSVPKITAYDKNTAIHHRQQPAKSQRKVTKENITDEPNIAEEVKHIDIRI